MNFYETFLEENKQLSTEIKKKIQAIFWGRLISSGIAFFSIYNFIESPDDVAWLITSLFTIVIFGVLIYFNNKFKWKARVINNKIKINEEELHYLTTNELPMYDDGSSYEDHSHPYAYDLDIFGRHSIYQFINRASSYFGKKNLAKAFLTNNDKERIESLQESIKTLSKKENTKWRQDFAAVAMEINDTEEKISQLKAWCLSKENLDEKPNQFFKQISIISSIAPLALLIAYYVFSIDRLLDLFYLFFFFNLGYLGRNLKKIRLQSDYFNQAYKVLKRYALLLQKIESKSFKSHYLVQQQAKLKEGKSSAFEELSILAKNIQTLDSFHNIIGAIIFNGFFLTHIKTLYSLHAWRIKHGENVIKWLEVVGEFEMLHSIATYAVNHPNYQFPSINQEHEILFENMGHPLLPSHNRVSNTISFEQHAFVILTGSNMSGKSTFLRSIGINLVLSHMGAPICCTKASVHPMRLLVSMRHSDSLADGDSYFLAEVKKLKTISDVVKSERCFVLLDEILRGTNSDDKVAGSIAVIKNILSHRTMGIIATHDLKVCELEKDYPSEMTNFCFESKIEKGDLYFDYQLKKGICSSKSASFLLEKYEVVPKIN